MGHYPGGARTSVVGSIPTFFSNRYKGFCLHGPHALALWWLFPFVELTGGSPRVHIYISCLPWRHSLLLSRGRLALSGRKAGVRRVGMIATLAKAPRAFGSVRKRGCTPTDQSPVWQSPCISNGMPALLSLTPQITLGDCDYASVASPLRQSHSLGSLYMPYRLTSSPWQCIPSPTHLMYSTRRGERHRGCDGL